MTVHPIIRRSLLGAPLLLVGVGCIDDSNEVGRVDTTGGTTSSGGGSGAPIVTGGDETGGAPIGGHAAGGVAAGGTASGVGGTAGVATGGAATGTGGATGGAAASSGGVLAGGGAAGGIAGADCGCARDGDYSVRYPSLDCMCPPGAADFVGRPCLETYEQALLACNQPYPRVIVGCGYRAVQCFNSFAPLESYQFDAVTGELVGMEAADDTGWGVCRIPVYDWGVNTLFFGFGVQSNDCSDRVTCTLLAGADPKLPGSWQCPGGGGGTGGVAGGGGGSGGVATGGAPAGGASSVVECEAVSSLPDMGSSCTQLGQSLCLPNGDRCVCTHETWFCNTACASTYPTVPVRNSACLAGAACNYPTGEACMCIAGRWMCHGVSTSRCPVLPPSTGAACDDLVNEYCEGYPLGSEPGSTFTCSCDPFAGLPGASWTCRAYNSDSCPETQPSYSLQTMCPLGASVCRYGSTYCLCMSYYDGSPAPEPWVLYPWFCGLATYPWGYPGI